MTIDEPDSLCVLLKLISQFLIRGQSTDPGAGRKCQKGENYKQSDSLFVGHLKIYQINIKF